MLRKLIDRFRRKPNPEWRFVAFQIMETTHKIRR